MPEPTLPPSSPSPSKAEALALLASFQRSELPSQAGRLAVVTGANAGLGFESARRLCHAGAKVILACRSQGRGEAAVKRILEEKPAGSALFRPLDLAQLESVKAFAESFHRGEAPIDLLLLNAGVMTPPTREETADGFELQFGVNHLGHFALVAQILRSLSEEARITVVSSMAHRGGRIDLEDLQWIKRPYSRWGSYGQSKLANLLFAAELQRRLRLGERHIKVSAAHPGWTATELQRNSTFFRVLNPLMAMKPAQGALPSLHALTCQELQGGEYLGPRGFKEMRGNPKIVGRSKEAQDPEMARLLWERSEALVGLKFDLPAGSTLASGAAR